MTKQVIGRGQESGGLYILDLKLPKLIACSRIASLQEVLYRLGHSSLSLLKKLFPQFSSLSSLNCELCQYDKLHLVHLSPRVNEGAFAPFELIPSNVWGPYPVMSDKHEFYDYFYPFLHDFLC